MYFLKKHFIGLIVVLAVLALAFGVDLVFNNEEEQSSEPVAATTTVDSITEQVTTTTTTPANPIVGRELSSEIISEMPVAQQIPVDQPFDELVEIGDCEFGLVIREDRSFGVSASTCYAGYFSISTYQGEQTLVESMPIQAPPAGVFAGTGIFADNRVRDVIVACPADDIYTCEVVEFV